jgi:hypothetical protein
MDGIKSTYDYETWWSLLLPQIITTCAFALFANISVIIVSKPLDTPNAPADIKIVVLILQQLK